MGLRRTMEVFHRTFLAPSFKICTARKTAANYGDLLGQNLLLLSRPEFISVFTTIVQLAVVSRLKLTGSAGILVSLPACLHHIYYLRS